MIQRKPLRRGNPPSKRKKKFGPSLRYELILGGAVRKYPNGREVCQQNAAGDREYANRVLDMLDRQNGVCCNCGDSMRFEPPTFEHENGRGASKQDDRIEIDGKRVNGASHVSCNLERGSKRTPLRFQ